MKKAKKLIISLVLTIMLCLSLLTPAFATAPEEPVALPEADILDVSFGEKSLSATSTLGTVSIAEYSSANTPKETPDHVGEQVITHDFIEYKVMGFAKDSKTNTVGIDMSASKADLEAALKTGFTLEAAFTIPTLSTSATSIIGATSGGGFGISISPNGELKAQMHTGSSYAEVLSADTFTAGEYVHIALVFDAENAKIQFYINGKSVGETDAAKFNPGGWKSAIGLGGSTASTTNYTNFATNPNIYTLCKIYSDGFTSAQAEQAYKNERIRIGMTEESGEQEEQPVRDFDKPVLRFLVTSDIQPKDAEKMGNQRIKELIRQSYERANNDPEYNEIDAILIAGDLSETGSREDTTLFYNALTEYLDKEETQVLAIMGNHENYDLRWETGVDSLSGEQRNEANAYIAENSRKLFEEFYGEFVEYDTGETYDYLNLHVKINGYHFIGISSDWENRWAYDYNSDTVSWLRTELAKAVAEDPSKPVFVFGHVGEVDTIAGTESALGNDKGSNSIGSVLQQYPQVVFFSGHSHYPIASEGSVHQKYYTSLGTGSITDATTIKVNGQSIRYTGTTDVDMYYMIEVDQYGNVRIKTYDISENEQVWKEIDLSAPFNSTKNFTYTEGRFDEMDVIFDADAQLEITGLTKSLVSFQFPQANPYLENGLSAALYYATVEDVSGNIVASAYMGDDWFNYTNDKNVTGTLGGLSPDTEYTLKVYGVNSKYTKVLNDGDGKAIYSAKPLVQTFKTAASPGDPLTPDILNINIDAENEKVSDISMNEMTATAKGSPIFKYDDTIDRNVIILSDGATIKLSDYVDDALAMSYGFTIEAYFSIDEFPEATAGNPIASLQDGGFGFEALSDGTVLFQANNGSYQKITKTMEQGLYYHWVCVYNGSTLTAYVNGNKLGSIACNGPLTFQADSGKVVYLGSDTNATGDSEKPVDCSIAITRIYSEALTAEQANILWENVADGRDKDIYNDDAYDPEYLTWIDYDDSDSEHVIYIGANGSIHDDHTDCTDDPTNIKLDGDTLQRFGGAHLINSTGHAIDGKISAQLTFVGSAFKFQTQYRGPSSGGWGDTLEVYVDGLLYDTITGLSGNNLTNKFEYMISGLEHKEHIVTFKCIDGRVMIDNFSIGYSDKPVKKEFQITISCGEGGTTDVQTKKVTEGEDLTINFTPDAGYVIEDVKINGESIGSVPSYTAKSINADLNIEASFKKLTFTVTANESKNGVITISNDAPEYGDDVQITVTPDEGYVIEDVKINGESVGAAPEYTISSIKEDTTIEAEFALIPVDNVLIEDDNTTEDEETSNVKTGDELNLILWIVIFTAFLAVAGGAFIFIRTKKDK